MSELNIDNSQITLLVEIDGKVYLMGMDKDNYEAISMLIKRSTKLVIPTNKKQSELRLFLGLDK